MTVFTLYRSIRGEVDPVEFAEIGSFLKLASYYSNLHEAAARYYSQVIFESGYSGAGNPAEIISSLEHSGRRLLTERWIAMGKFSANEERCVAGPYGIDFRLGDGFSSHVVAGPTSRAVSMRQKWRKVSFPTPIGTSVSDRDSCLIDSTKQTSVEQSLLRFGGTAGFEGHSHGVLSPLHFSL